MPSAKLLPNDDNIARACGEGHEDGVILAAAFEMRPQEHSQKKISVDWIECPCDSEANRNEDGSVARLKARGVKRVQPVAFLAVDAIHSIERGEAALEVIHDGKGAGARACHCAISGFTGGIIDVEIRQDLADIANQRDVKWIQET